MNMSMYKTQIVATLKQQAVGLHTLHNLLQVA